MADDRIITYDVLNALLDDCIHFFSKKCNQESFASINTTLLKIKKNLHYIKSLTLNVIRKNLHKYDIAPGLHANGYRSLLSLLDSLLLTVGVILKALLTECSNLFFRANEHLDKLELCSDIIHQVRALLYYSEILISLTPNGDLFISDKCSSPLLHDCEVMAKACFYGSFHGFQYAGGMQAIMQSFLTLSAQYHDFQQPTGTWSKVKSAINSGRYVLSPELRAEKLEKIYNSGDVSAIRKFWFLPEQGIVQTVPSIVGHAVQVNRIFKIVPKDLFLNSTKSEQENLQVEILSPQEQPIRGRLLSHVLREGQDDVSSPSYPDDGFDKFKMTLSERKVMPKSKKLVFFCHGGGFVSLTSKSFEIVLREWSKEFHCPIFCVDYSLAPESPFPKAFDQCFYAYAWALKHCHFLGTTAERIVFVGDSAGGNLILSLALRCGDIGIRMPDSLVAIYPACVIQPSISPARLMSVMDPILPLGVLCGCLSAYAGCDSNWVKRKMPEDGNKNDETQPDSSPVQPFLMKYWSNLRKDLEESINRIHANGDWINNDTRWWDEQFHILHLDSNNDNQCHDGDMNEDKFNINHDYEAEWFIRQLKSLKESPISPDAEFKIKLPDDFEPLRSKHYGDHFHLNLKPIEKNPFMSPFLASDEMLMKLPHIDFVGAEFDPLLDDSIILAKRFETLKKSYSFQLVKGLPHGFLTLQLTKEASDAGNICMQLVAKALHEAAV